MSEVLERVPSDHGDLRDVLREHGGVPAQLGSVGGSLNKFRKRFSVDRFHI